MQLLQDDRTGQRNNARRLHGSTQSPDEVLRQARAAHGSRMASLARTNQVLDAHLRAHARRASAGRLQFEDAAAANRGGGGGGAPLMMSSVLVDLGGDMLTLGLMDARVDVMLDQEGLCMPRGVSHGGGSSGGGGSGGSSGGGAGGCTASAATAADVEAKLQQRQEAARLVDDDEEDAAAAFAAAGAAAASRGFVDSSVGDEEGQGASSSESMEDGGDDGDDAGVSRSSGAVAACPVSIGSEVPAIAPPGAAAVSPATTPGGAPRTCRNRRMSSGGADGIIALLQHHTARATSGAGADAGFSGNPALTAAAAARTATNTTADVRVSAGSDTPWGTAAAAQAASAAAAAAATMAGDNSSPVSPRMRRRSALLALDLAAAGLAADPWSEAAAAALPGSAVHTLMLNQHYGGGQLQASQSSQQHPLVSPRRLRLPRASAPSAGVAAGAAAAGGTASLPPSPRRAAGVSGCGEGTAAAAVAAADGATGGARLCFGHAEVPIAPTSPPPVAVAHAWELQPQAGMAAPSSPLRAATLDASVERASPPAAASPPAVFSVVSPSPPCSPHAGAAAMGASGGSYTSAASPLVAPVARSGILSLSATHASRGAAASSTSSADGAASAVTLPRHQQHQNPHQQREAPKQRQRELQQGTTGWMGDAESTMGQRQRPSGHRANSSSEPVGTCEERPVGEEPLAVMDVDVAAAELPSSAVAAMPLSPPPSPQPQLPQTHRAIARRETAPGAAAHPGASPSPSPPLRYGSGTALPGGAAAWVAVAVAAADNESVPAPGSPTAVLAPSSPNVRRRLAAGSLTLQMPPPGLQALQSTLQPLQPPQQLPRGHGFSQGGVAPAAAAAAAVLAQASPLAVVARASDGGAASNLPQRQQQLSLTCAQGGGSAVGGDVWALAEAATSPRVSAPVSPGPTAAATAATRIVTGGGAALAAPPAAPLSPAGHGIYVPPTSAGGSATTGLPPGERQEFPVMAESYPLPAARAKSSSSQGNSAAAATGPAWRPPALPAAATAARNRLAVAAPHGAYAHQYGRDGPASAPVIRAGAATASGGNAAVADGNGGSSASPVLLLSRRPELFRKGWSSSLNGSSSIARRGGILAAAAAGSSSSFTDGTTPIRKRMTAAATALEIDPIATATSTAAASMTTTAGATVGDGGDGADGGTAGMSVMRSGPAFSWGARRSSSSSSSSGGGRSSLPSTATGVALQPSSCHPAHRPPSASRNALLLRTARSATEAAPAPVPALMQPAAALPRSSAPHPPPLAPSEAREESEDQPAASSRLQQPEQHQHNQQPTGHRPLLLLHSSGTGALAPTSPRGLLSATTSTTTSTVAGPHSLRQQQSQLLPSTRAHPLLSSSTSQPQSAQPAPQPDRHTPRRQASSTHGGDRDSGPLAAEGSSFAASTAAAAAAAAAAPGARPSAAPVAPGARPSAAPVAPAAAWDKAMARAHTSVTPSDTEGREAAAVAAPSMARRFAALSEPQGLWGAEPAAPQHGSHPAPPRKCGAMLAVANTMQPQPLLQPQQQPQQPLPPLPPLQRPQEEAAHALVPESLLPDKPSGQRTTVTQARADNRSSSSSSSSNSQRSRSAHDEQPLVLVTRPPSAVATGSSRTDGQEARNDAALGTAVANEGPGGTARHVQTRRDGSDSDMVAPDAQHGTRAGASTGIAAEASTTANNNGDCSSGSSGGSDGSGGGSSRAHIADSGSSGPAVGSTSVLARMKRALSTLRTYSTVY